MPASFLKDGGCRDGGVRRDSGGVVLSASGVRGGGGGVLEDAKRRER